ncbi:hypothetical protein KFL_003240160 [Klebsormidium nitens]|uniref:Polymerase nucleotidyl transferase domain-containing protein n=1 Tax=Klebsormidium nitens TaxID=105231 RepID=A0A1Y1I7Q7_KLENI|nr:hypothetical protein KFL_003240160 [Klebsormidium nitens]|eukprot:GAQ86995.1 hypothetical protein KFL_003240160 [Klebsormidium nitens]
MSSRAEVQPGGPSKKPSNSSPPVVYINGLEAAKVPRVQVLKVRRKPEGDLAEKIEGKVEGRIVQVVAPGPSGKAGGQRKAAATSVDGGDRAPRATLKQSASSESVSLEDRAADRATAKSGAQVATSVAEKTGESECRDPSGQLAAASSTAATSPASALASGRGGSEGKVKEVVSPARSLRKGADAVLQVRLDAVQGHDSGAGLAVEHTASFKDGQQLRPEDDVQARGPPSPEKHHPETAPHESRKSTGKDKAAGDVPVRAHEAPAEVLSNGAAAALRIEESQGASTAGDRESLADAHQRIDELLSRVSPKKPADTRRRAIVNYVCNLINSCFPAAVSTFGSVPLKTYLPDGDIDVVAFASGQPFRSQWANEVRAALDREEKKQQAEFRVREVQFIQAEVKLIKCLIENIVVDISFNQLSGICTLCFLEVVDREIARQHLFKRSVILVKAWCYYESRILGAHHGLISTYALETLVLYTFQVFHASLSGPLDVLYRFLSFFSSFDWDKHCLSLRGIIPLSSLPSLKAEAPVAELGGSLLLSEEFLTRCVERFAVIPEGEGAEAGGRPFVAKAMNIQDPLLYYNNLGRSVSKGNLSRIRTALKKGAATLGGILAGPAERLLPDLDRFFANTWRRHATGLRPDVGEPRRRGHNQRGPSSPLAAQQAAYANGYVGGSMFGGGDADVAGGRNERGAMYPEVGAPFSSRELAEAARAVAREVQAGGSGRLMENGSSHGGARGEKIEKEGSRGLRYQNGGEDTELPGEHVRGGVRPQDVPRAEVVSGRAALGVEAGIRSGRLEERGSSRQRQAQRDRSQESGSRHAGGSAQSTPSSSPRAGAPYPSVAGPNQHFEAGASGAVVDGVPLSFFGGLPRVSGTGAFFPSPDALRVPSSPSEPATGLPYWLLQAASALGGPHIVEGLPVAAGTPLERSPAGSGGAQPGSLPRLVGDIPIPIVNLEGPPSPRVAVTRSVSRSPPSSRLLELPRGLSEAGTLVTLSSSPAEGLPGGVPLPPPLQLPEPASGSGAEGHQAARTSERRIQADQAGVRHGDEGRGNGERARGYEGEQSRSGAVPGSAGGGYQWGEQEELLLRAAEAGVPGLALPSGMLSWGQFADPHFHLQQLLANGYGASSSGLQYAAQQYGGYAPQGSFSPRSGRQEQRSFGRQGGAGEGQGREERGRSSERDQQVRGERAGEGTTGLGEHQTEAMSPSSRRKHEESGRGPSRERSVDRRTAVSSPCGSGALANGIAAAQGGATLERKGSMERGSKGGSVRQAWVAKGGEEGQAAVRDSSANATREGQSGSTHKSTEAASEDRAGVSKPQVEERALAGPVESKESLLEGERSRRGGVAAAGAGNGRGAGHRRQYSEGSIDFQARQAVPAAAFAEMGTAPGADRSPRGMVSVGSLPDQLLYWPNGPSLEAGLPGPMHLPPGSMPNFPSYYFRREQRQEGREFTPGEANGEAAHEQARPSRPDARDAGRGEGEARQWSQEDDWLQRAQSPAAGEAAHARPRPQQGSVSAPPGYPPAFYIPHVGIPYGPAFSWEAAGGLSLNPSMSGRGVGTASGAAQPSLGAATESQDPSRSADDESASDEDLLEGDLEAHLRSLEFGRHCQQQVDRGQKWQPPLPPPQAPPGAPPQGQYGNSFSGSAPQQKGQPRSNSHPGAHAPHIYGPTLRSPQGGPTPHWQQPPQQQHKFSGKGQRSGGSLTLQRHGEEAFRQMRGGEGRSAGVYSDPGRLYMPQGHGVGVHFLEGDARQPADLFARGGVGPGIPRVRSADSYSSEGLHLDPRGPSARYLDARMQSPRIARVPIRVGASADFRLHQYSPKDGLDIREQGRGGRDGSERPDWQVAGGYFPGTSVSPRLEAPMAGFNPAHWLVGVRRGAPSEAFGQGAPKGYPTPPQQPSTGATDERPRSVPGVPAGAIQEDTSATPKLRSIRESEERDPLPGLLEKEAGAEGGQRRGEGWERPSQPQRGADVQPGGRDVEEAGRELERQASGGSAAGLEQQAGGGNAAGPEEGTEAEESSQQFSEEDFPPLSTKAQPGGRSKPGSASPRSGKNSPKGGGA